MKKSHTKRSDKGKSHADLVYHINIDNEDDSTKVDLEKRDVSTGIRIVESSATPKNEVNLDDEGADYNNTTFADGYTFIPDDEPSPDANATSSKKRSIKNKDSVRRRKRCMAEEDRDLLLQEARERTDLAMRTIQREMPYSLDDALKKLDSLDNLTETGLLSMITALQADPNNRTVFMNFNGKNLKCWMRRIVEIDEKFGHLPVFTDD